MRADVFEALAAHERPASAYDIAEDVGKRRGNSNREAPLRQVRAHQIDEPVE
ncbi:hypothetical protein D3C83_97620 [compost metagenome]